MITLKHKHNRKISAAGFTLIEITIVMFVAGLLLTVLFALFGWHEKMYNYQEAVIRTSGSGRASLQALSFYVSQAHRISDTQTIGGMMFTTGTSTLVAQLPAVDGNGDIVAGKWDYAVFYADGNNFYELVQADGASSRWSGTKLLSDTLRSAVFTYDSTDPGSAKKVSADISTQLWAKDRLVTDRLQQNIYLKNY